MVVVVGGRGWCAVAPRMHAGPARRLSTVGCGSRRAQAVPSPKVRHIPRMCRSSDTPPRARPIRAHHHAGPPRRMNSEQRWVGRARASHVRRAGSAACGGGWGVRERTDVGRGLAWPVPASHRPGRSHIRRDWTVCATFGRPPSPLPWAFLHPGWPESSNRRVMGYSPGREGPDPAAGAPFSVLPPAPGPQGGSPAGPGPPPDLPLRPVHDRAGRLGGTEVRGHCVSATRPTAARVRPMQRPGGGRVVAASAHAGDPPHPLPPYLRGLRGPRAQVRGVGPG
jgi:hypothetical protein